MRYDMKPDEVNTYYVHTMYFHENNVVEYKGILKWYNF